MSPSTVVILASVLVSTVNGVAFMPKDVSRTFNLNILDQFYTLDKTTNETTFIRKTAGSGLFNVTHHTGFQYSNYDAQIFDFSVQDLIKSKSENHLLSQSVVDSLKNPFNFTITPGEDSYELTTDPENNPAKNFLQLLVHLIRKADHFAWLIKERRSLENSDYGDTYFGKCRWHYKDPVQKESYIEASIEALLSFCKEVKGPVEKISDTEQDNFEFQYTSTGKNRYLLKARENIRYSENDGVREISLAISGNITDSEEEEPILSSSKPYKYVSSITDTTAKYPGPFTTPTSAF